MERREFIKLSLTAAGGLSLGFYLPGPRAAAAAVFAPNAWLRIDPDNRITFICPQNEMGQDVHTSLAVLLAEELGVPVGSLEIVQAPAHPAYMNGMLGGQLTGGSTSVRNAWVPLRQPQPAGCSSQRQRNLAARWGNARRRCRYVTGRTASLSCGAGRDRRATGARVDKVRLKAPAAFANRRLG
jgi:hypothetical protein